MEHIRQALERAKGTGPLLSEPVERGAPTRSVYRTVDQDSATFAGARQVSLDPRRLEANRVVAHDISSPHCRTYDMLRTQVLQSMDKKGWHFLAITSPTPACGKSLTAINLAFSIARQPDRSVLVVDLDLLKPNVAQTLGINGNVGLLSMLEGQTAMSDSITQANIGSSRINVLPVFSSVHDSSQWLASRAMAATLQDMRANFKSSIVIFDLPPVLHSDDVISVLPHMDCLLFVTAVGTTTKADIKECNKFLQTTDVVRVVVNKIDEPSRYYYPAYGQNT